MDPNWFYSTLSQSSAALIGLFGGIYASRLMGSVQLADESKRSLIKDYLNLRVTFLTLAKNARNFAESASEFVPEARTAFEENRRSNNYFGYMGPNASNKNTFMDNISKEFLDLLELFASQGDEIANQLEKMGRLLDVSDLTDSVNEFANFLGGLDGIGDYYEHELEEAAGLADLVESHKSKFSYRHSWIILLSLSLLATFGVAVPLGFLAAGTHTLHLCKLTLPVKDLLIGAFVAGVAVIMLYLQQLTSDVNSRASLELDSRDIMPAYWYP